jgi:hypothetical protein
MGRPCCDQELGGERKIAVAQALIAPPTAAQMAMRARDRAELKYIVGQVRRGR